MAAEPESLAIDEALSRHVARHNYDRLIMLSDGIFAIATTLAALEIHLPDNAGTVAAMVAAVGRALLGYGVSFMVIAVFWVSNRDLFARLQRVDAPLTALTLLMLCVVAVIPATAHVVYRPGAGDAAFDFYCLVMTVCGLINTAMWGYAAGRRGLMRDEMPARARWGRIIAAATMPLLFGTVAAMPAPVVPQLIVPVLLALIAIRRIIIPRWFADNSQKSAA